MAPVLRGLRSLLALLGVLAWSWASSCAAGAETRSLPGVVLAPGSEDVAAYNLVVPPGGSAAVGRIFARFDADADGRLTAPELARFARGPSDLPVDPNADRSISPPEFTAAFFRQKQPRKLSTASYLISLLLTGRRLLALGCTGWARELYEEAARDHPDCAEALLGLGRAQEAASSPSRAADAYLKATEVDPSLEDAWASLARVQARLGRSGPARTALACWQVRWELEKELLGGLGEGDLEQVRTTARELVRAWPRGASTPELEGWLAALGAPSAGPGRPESGQALSCPLCRVRRHVSRGWLKEALACCDEELAKSRPPARPESIPGRESRGGHEAGQPSHWRLRLAKAFLEGALRATGKASETLALARQAGAPEDLLTVAELGLALDLGDAVRADQLSRRLESLRPAPWVRVDLGWQLGSRSDWRRALSWLEGALASAFNSEECRALLALCQTGLGDLDAARRTASGLAAPQFLSLPLLAPSGRLLESFGLVDQAVQMTRELTRRLPHETRWRLWLARLLGRAGKHLEQAEVLYTGLLLTPVADPDWPELATRLAWETLPRFVFWRLWTGMGTGESWLAPSRRLKALYDAHVLE